MTYKEMNMAQKMTAREAMKSLGINEVILNATETGEILGLMYNTDGKPYSRRTVANWHNAGRLARSRKLGRDIAVPLIAIDPDQFTPPTRGRPPTNNK